jgi:hypothetical protein
MTRVRRLAVLVLLVGTGCYGPRAYYVEPQVMPARRPVSREDVRTLVRAGVGDEIIATKIRAEGVTARPTADEVVALKKDGASDKVVEAMLAAPVTSAAPARVVYPPPPYPYGGWGPWSPYPWGPGYYAPYWP